MAGVTRTYAYDPLDRLVAISEGGTEVVRFRYVGQTASVAQLLDGSWAVTRSIAVDAAGSALADWAPGGTGWRRYLTNGHGDLMAVAAADGTISASLRLDPWGVPLRAVPAGYPAFGFQGSLTDRTTTLVHARARWYDPVLATFTSEDPYPGELADPSSRHRYAYGAGDPVDRTDPEGLFWYKVRSGDTLAGIAKRYLTNRQYWPMLLNANRGTGVVRPRDAVSAGGCLWIPSSWVAAAMSRRGDPCGSGRGQPSAAAKATYAAKGTGGIPKQFGWGDNVDRAARRLYVFGGFRNLDSRTLRSLTISWTNSWPGDRTVTTRMAEAVNTMNSFARSFLHDSRGNPNGTVRRWNGLREVFENTIWPTGMQGPRVYAVTIGEHIFYSRKFTFPPPDWLRSHEYMHVLQLEGYGLNFLPDYFWYWLRKDVQASPSNPYESIGYLWQGWTYLTGEKPWTTWWRPAP